MASEAVTDSDVHGRLSPGSRNGDEEQPNLPGLEPPETDYWSHLAGLAALITGRTTEQAFWHEIDGLRYDGLSIGLDENGRVWGATWAAWLDREIRRDREETRAARERGRIEARQEARRRIHRFREEGVTDSVALVVASLEAVTTLDAAVSWDQDQPLPKGKGATNPPRALWLIQARVEGAARLEDEPCAMCAGHSGGYYRSMCDEHLVECFRREARRMIRQCRACGRAYLDRPAWDDRVGLCSSECEAVTKAEAARARRTDSRNALRLRCQVCDEPLDVDRSDARYCSSACRQKAYRGRKGKP
jgi:hypothetical protein